jgi:hypothetical protein
MMKRNFVAVLYMLVIFIFSGGIFSQTPAKLNQPQIVLQEIEKYPELGTDISKIAKLKAFLPKQKYHLQETMILDFVLLIDNQESYFLPKDLPARIIIKDAQQNRVLIDTIYAIDKTQSYEKYQDAIIRGSTILLIGCDNKIMDEIGASAKFIFSEDINVGFEKGLFRTFPQGCIDINKASKLEIYVEVYNDFVVRPANKETVKTAVGKIKSNVLAVEIKE